MHLHTSITKRKTIKTIFPTALAVGIFYFSASRKAESAAFSMRET